MLPRNFFLVLTILLNDWSSAASKFESGSNTQCSNIHKLGSDFEGDIFLGRDSAQTFGSGSNSASANQQIQGTTENFVQDSTKESDGQEGKHMNHAEILLQDVAGDASAIMRWAGEESALVEIQCTQAEKSLKVADKSIQTEVSLTCLDVPPDCVSGNELHMSVEESCHKDVEKLGPRSFAGRQVHACKFQDYFLRHQIRMRSRAHVLEFSPVAQ